MTAPKTRIPPRVSDRIGILSPYGRFWTNDTFDTPEQAEKHLRDFWRDTCKHAGQSLDEQVAKFFYVPVTVTIAAVEMLPQQVEPVTFAKRGDQQKDPEA